MEKKILKREYEKQELTDFFYVNNNGKIPVTGHRKRQFELHRRQTNSLSFSKFIKSSFNLQQHYIRCIVVLTGALRISGPQR